MTSHPTSDIRWVKITHTGNIKLRWFDRVVLRMKETFTWHSLELQQAWISDDGTIAWKAIPWTAESRDHA